MQTVTTIFHKRICLFSLSLSHVCVCGRMGANTSALLSEEIEEIAKESHRTSLFLFILSRTQVTLEQ